MTPSEYTSEAVVIGSAQGFAQDWRIPALANCIPIVWWL